MKAIRFDRQNDFHLLAFRRVRNNRRLHTRCGIRPGALDRIVQVKDLAADDLCNTCYIRATPRQKRKFGHE